MRHVAHALLEGVDGKQAQAAVALTASPDKDNGRGLPGGPCADSARYLRDRVGVPRDLPFPAARQLRAHLNWLIDIVDPTPV